MAQQTRIPTIAASIALFLALNWEARADAPNHAANTTPSPSKIITQTQLAANNTGTLVLPPNRGCGTLKLFFPGHAQELGFADAVPQAREKDWALYLLGPGGNYNLLPAIQESGYPVMIMGDSQKNISDAEIQSLLKKSGTKQLEIISHSGGFDGLSRSLKSWSSSTVDRIAKVSLLDTFYDSDPHQVLRSRIGQRKLKKICGGFSTPHNEDRYRSRYVSFCRISHYPSGSHKSPVKYYF